MWLLCSFQGPSRGVYAGRRLGVAGALSARLAPPPADAGLSKLNSMLALFMDSRRVGPQVARSPRRACPPSQVRSTC